MKVVVTGAGGFVGEALCRRLSASGCLVTGTFRDQPSPRDWMETQITGDLTQLSDFKNIVKRSDIVIHLAARVHKMRDTVADPGLAFRQANTDVTQRLAQAAANAGSSRFIFLSSVKVNGEETAGIRSSEKDMPARSDAYAQSKRDAEDALQEIAATTKMVVTTLRVPLVYGPAVRANFAALMQLCDTAMPLPLDGITRNRRSLLYLGNLTHALETIVMSGNGTSGTYLLSDGEDLSTSKLVSYLRRSLNRHPLRLPVPAPIIQLIASLAGKQEVARRLCGSLQIDSTEFRQAFGWAPPFSPAQGIAVTVAAHRATR